MANQHKKPRPAGAAARPRRASSIDVAQLAGVSQSAVSRTFTVGAVVSRKTRDKVLAAAASLNYRPNVLARSLITRSTKMVALVIGDIENPFFAKLVNAFSTRLQAHGLHVLLFSVTGDDKVEAAVNEMLKYRVDGVLLVSAHLSNEMADACHRVGTPVVLCNRYSRGTAVSSVRVENYEGGRSVANFLLDGGHQRIALVAGTRTDATGFDRESGFRGRLEERGANVWQAVSGDYSFRSGYQAAKQLLCGAERPDAVFCLSDLMALGVIEAARQEFGLQIPRDLSVVGFDDIPMAAWPSYELTTFRQPVQAMADEALNLLIAQMQDANNKPVTRLIPGEIAVRSSSRVPG